MKFVVTAQDITRVFPHLKINAEMHVTNLDLDLGHLQLLADCYQAWSIDCQHFWSMLLHLVSEVNNGSLCLDLQSEVFDLFDVEQAINTWHQQSPSHFQLAGQPILMLVSDRLYWFKFHQAECDLIQSLERLTRNNQAISYPNNQITEALNMVAGSVKFTLTAEQKLAVATSLLKPFSIISGGPGTGKTTIMTSVLRALVYVGVDPGEIALAAPTGRAAYRMSDSLHSGLRSDLTKPLSSDEVQLLQLEAHTIHHLIGVKPWVKKPQYNTDNRLPFRCVIIDEVSMVDLILMNQLLAALADDVRLILLGDQFQLPSVNSGAVLTDLMPPVGQALISQSHKQQLSELLPECQSTLAQLPTSDQNALLQNCVTVLVNSQRCQPDIATLSEYVRQGDEQHFFSHQSCQHVPVSNDWAKTGFYWHGALLNEGQWRSYINSWIEYHFFKKHLYDQKLQLVTGFEPKYINEFFEHFTALFDCVRGNRILTLVNQGMMGQLGINQQACQWMKKQLNTARYGQNFEGAVIMVQQSDSRLKLFNGDVGILVNSSRGLRAVFPDSQGYCSFALHVIPPYQAAFAMTVHKSQGSEFNHVLMPLPEDINHRLLSREIIYTGITRAKHSAHLVGSKAVVKMAIERYSKRQSGLCLWD